MRPPGPLEIGLIVVIIINFSLAVIFIIWLFKRVVKKQVSIEMQKQAHKEEQERD